MRFTITVLIIMMISFLVGYGTRGFLTTDSGYSTDCPECADCPSKAEMFGEYKFVVIAPREIHQILDFELKYNQEKDIVEIHSKRK